MEERKVFYKVCQNYFMKVTDSYYNEEELLSHAGKKIYNTTDLDSISSMKALAKIYTVKRKQYRELFLDAQEKDFIKGLNLRLQTLIKRNVVKNFNNSFDEMESDLKYGFHLLDLLIEERFNDVKDTLNDIFDVTVLCHYVSFLSVFEDCSERIDKLRKLLNPEKNILRLLTLTALTLKDGALLEHVSPKEMIATSHNLYNYFPDCAGDGDITEYELQLLKRNYSSLFVQSTLSVDTLSKLFYLYLYGYFYKNQRNFVLFVFENHRQIISNSIIEFVNHIHQKNSRPLFGQRRGSLFLGEEKEEVPIEIHHSSKEKDKVLSAYLSDKNIIDCVSLLKYLREFENLQCDVKEVGCCWFL